MKLRDLNARFTKYSKTAVDPTQWIDGVLHRSGWKEIYETVDTLNEADGIWFNCPLCATKPHPHRVHVGFEGKYPPGSYTKGSSGQDTRWKIVSGTGLDDLSLAPSIQLLGGCNWHGFIGFSNVSPGEAA